ncbi:MAG: aldo/keto reductase [Clostridia bacterium]|nr:aldo/keto reductase [Clostridia bacterium]
MEYVQLRHSDLTVSRLCMGCCPMGGYGWGETHEESFIAAIHTALEQGINFFDTADTYGLGQSEITLAKGLGNQRKDVVIQSKFGVRAGRGRTVIDNAPDYIETALNGTLERLHTDYLDLYVVHYWDQKTPIADIVGTLERLREKGKIRYFGISNIRSAHMTQWLPFAASLTTAQYEFSLSCRTHESELKEAARFLDVSPLTWGSLGQGILTGKYDASASFGADDRRSREIYINFHGDKLRHNLQIVERLRTLAERYQRPVAACALRFILDYLDHSIVMVGIKNPDQLNANAQAIGWTMQGQDLRLLDQISRSPAMLEEI